MKDQSNAANLSTCDQPRIKCLIYDITRCINNVLSRTPRGAYFAIYTIYWQPNMGEFSLYLKDFIKKMNEKHFPVTILLSQEEFSVLRIDWRHPHIDS